MLSAFNVPTSGKLSSLIDSNGKFPWNKVTPGTVIAWVKFMKVVLQMLRKEAKKIRKAYLKRHGHKMADPIFSSADRELSGKIVLPASVFSHVHLHELRNALQTLETLLQSKNNEMTVYRLMCNKLAGCEDVAQHISELCVEDDKWLVMFFKEFVPTPQNVELYNAFVNVHEALSVVDTMLNQLCVEYEGMDGWLPLPIRLLRLQDLFRLNTRRFTPLYLRPVHGFYPCFHRNHLPLIPTWITRNKQGLFPDVRIERICKLGGFPEPDLSGLIGDD